MDEKRIPLAWSVRWRRFRHRIAPVASFVLAAAVCAWLWELRGATVHAVGEVDAMRIVVTSPTNGLIVALPHESRGQWTLYDYVRAGDVIARFDDRHVRLARQSLLQEVRRLSDRLDEWKTQLDSDSEVAVAIWQAELTQLESLEEWLSGTSQRAADDTAPGQPELPSDLTLTAQSAFSDIQHARRMIEVRCDDLELQSEMLQVRAPLSGTLIDIHCWPGQAVAQGGLVATIAADHGRFIVSYLPEESPLALEVGMPVTLRSRRLGSPRLDSEIEVVGRQITPIPAHFVAAAATPQWGLPVRIKLPNDAGWRPGALVDVLFHRTGDLESGAAVFDADVPPPSDTL